MEQRDNNIDRAESNGSSESSDGRAASAKAGADNRKRSASAKAAVPRRRRNDPRRDFIPETDSYRGDYRGYRDYRDYRGTDYRGNDPVAGANDAQIDWASALWRYKYALLVPLILGIVFGAAYYTTQPNVYRSTARLVVESTKPWTPDADSKEAVSVVPPSELLLMQLRSEQVLDFAAAHPLLADIAGKMDGRSLRGVLAEGVGFQDAMMKTRSDRASAFFLHFDDRDPQFAIHAVTALSDGLQNFFAERSETSVAELKKLITTAKDKLLPELNALEAEYQQFRENSELSWDRDGQMVNPHRDKQLALQARRLELEDQERDLTTKLAAIRNTIESTQDPLLVMEVVQQLLGEELYAVKQLITAEDQVQAPMVPQLDEDLSLAKVTIERTLLPLEVERQQFATQFGAGHPSVKQLDQQIAATRAKLNELTAQETRRLTELRKEGESPSGDLVKAKRERAELAVSGFVRALETRKAVLESQSAQLDGQIVTLADQAAKLARQESENASFLRRIERSQKLFDSVEEQMTKVNLADQDASIIVTQLNSPSAPMLVSPILSKFLAVGGMLGGMIGLGLVYLLESQAKTYRSAEEIASALGMRVLSHVPTDTHKLPKQLKGEDYPYQGIDPGLSTVHRPRSATSEAVRKLRTGVFFEASAVDAKVIQVTSPVPEDGKSTLAANLAVSIARSGKTVVIVDADMRRPQMTASFGMESFKGLSELIDGSCDPTQVVHETPISNLSLVPCGPIPANPAEALSMYQFAEFLSWLRERYDYVIVDTPPLLIVTDPAIVASAVDGVVFTFRIRRGCRPQTKEAVAMLRATGTPIFGCVVNRVDHSTAGAGYQSYQSSTYYGRRYSSYAADSTRAAKSQRGSSKEFVVGPKTGAERSLEVASNGAVQDV